MPWAVRDRLEPRQAADRRGVGALPAIIEAVGGRVPVLFDSGVRGGADVFRALALGVHAVGLRRLYAYGLAVAAERGVREVVQNVVAELDLALGLGLAGCTSVAEVTAECLTASA